MVGEAAAVEECSPSGCGSALFLGLPDDVLALISARLRPRDLCSLARCCRRLLSAVAAAEKAWLAQCRNLGPAPHLLPRWRDGLRSYRALCRFLAAVRPLLGVWVHQNPELGNVVCVRWGFLSVVACRVIPQELGPHGLDAGPLLWAPVFEVLADAGEDGAPSRLFLHGRDRGEDCLYPGAVRPVDPKANVLLLEVDVRPKDRGFSHSGSFSASESTDSLSRIRKSYGSDIKDPNWAHSRSFSAAELKNSSSGIRKLCRSDTTDASDDSLQPPPPAPTPLPFGRLAFGDRRRLLELVASRVRIKVPPDLAVAPLFPCSDDDLPLLTDRRAALVRMHRLHGGHVDRKVAEFSEHRRASNGGGKSAATGNRRSFSSVADYLRDGLKQFVGRSSTSSVSGLITRNGASLGTGESKHVQLHEFLRSGDTIGLSLRAAHMRLTTYRAWPNMHDNRFALYKLPLQAPAADREFAGLWGGTFGWPPGRPSEDKPGKALFFLLLSYEEADGQQLLIATKILEGTHYVLHPNGSAMFIVKVDEPASETFPWETDGDSVRVEVKQTYAGEGIANGYGFRYPGSKPGSLFVIQNGLLAFVWKESKSVLTLQRLDLEELLKKGEQVPALPAIANFVYLTKSYSNVFAAFPSNSSCSPSPRHCH